MSLGQRRTDVLTVERPLSITFSSLRLFHLHPLMSYLPPGHCSPGRHLVAGQDPEKMTFHPLNEAPGSELSGHELFSSHADRCAYLKRFVPAASPHVSDLTLQLGSGLLTVLEAVLCGSQPQQLLLQQAVLSLQKNQLTSGRSCSWLPVCSDGPQCSRSRLRLLQQL